MVGEKHSGITQDKRLLTIACGLYPMLDELDNMVGSLRHCKIEALNAVATILLTEFGTGKGDNITINMDGLRALAGRDYVSQQAPSLVS